MKKIYKYLITLSKLKVKGEIMETKKIIRNTLIGASVLAAVAISSGCSSRSRQETAKNIGMTTPEIKKVVQNPFTSSCSELKKAAVFEMRRGRLPNLSDVQYTLNINDELIANNLLKIYSLKRCNEK